MISPRSHFRLYQLFLYLNKSSQCNSCMPLNIWNLERNDTMADIERGPSAVQSTSDKFIEAYLAARQLIETFRTVFHRLYLSALRDTYVWFHQGQRGALGDMVLVKEQSAPWPLNLIEKPNRRPAPAIVRIVHVSTTSRLLCPLKKTCPTTILVPSINRFYSFEASFLDLAILSAVPLLVQHPGGASLPAVSPHGSSVSLPPAVQATLWLFPVTSVAGSVKICGCLRWNVTHSHSWLRSQDQSTLHANQRGTRKRLVSIIRLLQKLS